MPRFFFFFTLFILLLGTSYALEVYDVSHDCPIGCVKNRPVTWSVNISNYGERDIYLGYVAIVNAANDAPVAYFGNQSSVDTAEMVWLRSEKTHQFIMKGKLPNATGDFLYQVCRVQQLPFQVWADTREFEYYCMPELHTIQTTDCHVDSDCYLNQTCSDNQCVDLGCNECQYYESHQCVDYSCCTNDDCALNAVCEEHECALLVCEHNVTEEALEGTEEGEDTEEETEEEADEEELEGEEMLNETNITIPDIYVVNHSCSYEPCSEGQILVNFACYDANCSDDEHVFNFTCTQLDCLEHEHAINHECVALNCKENEGYYEHSCVRLNCAFNEYLENHECKKLDCNLFQTIEENDCLVNSNILLHIVLIIGIILLATVDYKKLKLIRQHKVVDKLLKKAKPSKKAKSKKEASKKK